MATVKFPLCTNAQYCWRTHQLTKSKNSIRNMKQPWQIKSGAVRGARKTPVFDTRGWQCPPHKGEKYFPIALTTGVALTLERDERYFTHIISRAIEQGGTSIETKRERRETGRMRRKRWLSLILSTVSTPGLQKLLTVER